MPEFAADINANGKAIINIADSQSNSSAVRRDAMISAIQSAVNSITPSTIGLGSAGLLLWARLVARDPVITGGALPQIDGIQVVEGDIVLRIAEANLVNNGLFQAVANGNWTRAISSAQLLQGTIVSITEGVQNTGTGWVLTTTNPISGTTPLTFLQFNGGQRSGQFTIQIGNGSTTVFDLTHNLNTLNLQSILVRNTGSPYSIVTGYTSLILSANSIRLTFASAPTTNQYTVIITGQRDDIWSYDVIRDLQLSQASAIVQSQNQIVSLQSADTAFNTSLALKAPLDSPSFTGFTTLGDNIAIKCKRLTGTTASTQGGTTSVAHGIGTATKILAVSLTINYASGNILTDNYTAATGYQVQIGNIDNTNIAVVNVSANSANILSKPFNLLVTYIA